MPIQMSIAIVAEYMLSMKYGLNGIIMGLILCYLLTATWLLPYKFYSKYLVVNKK